MVGVLHIVIARTSTQDEVIEKLHMEEETWVRGQTWWTGKATLYTLTERDTGWLYDRLVDIFNAGMIDSCKYEWGVHKRNRFRISRRWKRLPISF